MTLQPLWACCEIPGYIGLRMRIEEVGNDYSVCQFWLSEERLDLDPRVREGVNPVVTGGVLVTPRITYNLPQSLPIMRFKFSW